jgi:hypothetical protein
MFRVFPADQIDEVNAYFAGYEDRTNGSCGWTADRQAQRFGVAIDWADRAYVGY